MIFFSSGILVYDPVAIKNETRSNPYWLILSCDPGLCEYYRYWLKKTKHVNLSPSAWGAHVSVIRGEKPVNESLWENHAGEEIEFWYDPIIANNESRYWISIDSPKLKEIRKELGLSELTILPNGDPMEFHITIGTLI